MLKLVNRMRTGTDDVKLWKLLVISFHQIYVKELLDAVCVPLVDGKGLEG